MKIGIVQARFNDDITNALATACIAELKAMGVADDRITHVHVPGALEVPLALAALAQDNRLEIFRLLVQAGPDGMAAALSTSRAGDEGHLACYPSSHLRTPHHRAI